jgi:long-chain acyl-CoA synthetase
MMTLSVFASACSRKSAESDLLGDTADAFPKLLLEHSRVRPDRPANREKDYAIWQCWNWAEVVAEV